MPRKPFNHIATGTSEDILASLRRNPKINAAILRQAWPEKLGNYLKNLTRNDLVLTRLPEDAQTYDNIGQMINFHAGKTTLADIKTALRAGFPDRPGFDDFARDVFDTLIRFCRATGYNNIGGGMTLSLPGGSGVWHHDNDTDVRGFKAYVSDGPLLRANDTVEHWRPRRDFYGRPGELTLPPNAVRQLREGEFGIWKGDCHNRPLIHVKPAVTPDELRVSLMIYPGNAGECKAMLKRLGLKRFYREPVL